MPRTSVLFLAAAMIGGSFVPASAQGVDCTAPENAIDDLLQSQGSVRQTRSRSGTCDCPSDDWSRCSRTAPDIARSPPCHAPGEAPYDPFRLRRVLRVPTPV